MKLKDATYIVVDFETTGLFSGSGDECIEAAGMS
jgi:DNA polymerase III alpha subunit (gram-positive type)